MQIVYLVLIVLWKVWFYVLAILFALLLSPFVWLFVHKSSHYPIAYKIIRVWAYIVFYGSGFRYKLNSDDKLNNNYVYIIISNHTSIVDIILMYILHPYNLISFVGKEELKKIPILGSIFKRTCIMVDRNSMKSRGEVYKSTKKKLKEQRSVVIFPEGGVSDDESLVLGEFKDGAFKISKSEGIPMVVYSIKGLKKSFPFDFFKGYPAKIEVNRLHVFSKEEVDNKSVDEVKESAFRMIYKSLF
ncbi:MAG: 1-acyl-sn-glycerol-3-phosphate acyltransferase [Flavobacteriales bacterium]|nr:1-acyl-sn-glycerol-3-phosphate acyltransferase [Flavobacteriales bacterium]